MPFHQTVPSPSTTLILSLKGNYILDLILIKVTLFIACHDAIGKCHLIDSQKLNILSRRFRVSEFSAKITFLNSFQKKMQNSDWKFRNSLIDLSIKDHNPLFKIVTLVCKLTLWYEIEFNAIYHEKSNHYQNQVTTLWSIGGGNHIL